MPYSSGTYSFVVNSWNPAVAATTISATDWNAQVTDLSTALSTCMLKDGTQTTTASIPFAAGLSTNTITEQTSGAGVTVDSVGLKDGNITLSDSSDSTKKATFAMSTIAAATTRTFTFPNANGTLALTSDLAVAAITSGTINGATIGGVTPAAGTFTTLTSTGTATLGDASGDTHTVNGAINCVNRLLNKGNDFIALVISITNDAGTIKGRVTASGYGLTNSGAQASAYAASLCSSSSNTDTALASVDSTTPFSGAGIGIRAAATNQLYINTGAQATDVGWIPTVVANDTGTAVVARPSSLSENINGSTIERSFLNLADNSGGSFNINTTNITAGKTLTIGLVGFFTGTGS